LQALKEEFFLDLAQQVALLADTEHSVTIAREEASAVSNSDVFGPAQHPQLPA
jgi:hypothetical protein